MLSLFLYIRLIIEIIRLIIEICYYSKTSLYRAFFVSPEKHGIEMFYCNSLTVIGQ